MNQAIFPTGLMNRFTMIVVGLSICGTLSASDHEDGESLRLSPASDITDVYASIVPSSRGPSLLAAMTVHPYSTEASRFSDAVAYEIVVRSASTSPNGMLSFGEQQWTLRFEFRGPPQTQQSVFTSKLIDVDGNSEKLLEVTSLLGESITESNVKIFAGPRADPFFVDVARARLPRMRKLDLQVAGINSVGNANVLAMVVEVPLTNVPKSLSGSKYWAVAGQTRRVSNNGNGRLLDRAGRPDISRYVLAKQMTGLTASATELAAMEALLADWNSTPCFDSQTTAKFLTPMKDGLRRLDELDGEDDWGEEDRNRLASILLTDCLILNLESTPIPANSAQSTLFGVERGILKGGVITAGGRCFNADAIDDLLTFLINGPRRSEPRRTDGVSRPALPASNVFPYCQRTH